jgi:hypothetical protein
MMRSTTGDSAVSSSQIGKTCALAEHAQHPQYQREVLEHTSIQ